jgi:hypothetical protein
LVGATHNTYLVGSKGDLGKPMMPKLSPAERERRVQSMVKMYEAWLKNGRQGIADRLEELELNRQGVQVHFSTEKPN